MSAPGLHRVQHLSQRLTQTLQRAIGLLQLDNAELSGLLIEEAATNPALRLRLPMPEEVPVRRGFWAAPAGLAGASGFDADLHAAQAAGLHAHVEAQIGLLGLRPAERRIAAAFLAALDPSGWLSDPLADVARAAGCDIDAAEAVLARLQGLEPAGLFARSLSECLGLQLADAGALSAPMRVLLDHLPALARGDSAFLMARCGVDAATLGRMVTLLRSLDPKPGAQFDQSPAERRAPDLVVSRDARGQWQVALNQATTPSVQVARLADPAGRAGLATARWLERTLSRRNQMILRVAGYVIAAQHEFLEHGATRLRPLTAAEVGAALGLHETTVGRIRNGLRVQTPGQVLPLQAFFGRGRVACAGGAALAGGAVAGLIADLVRAEPPEAPLSDSQLVAALAARGISLSRRTLTNWRNRAGIAPAADRRRPAAGAHTLGRTQ